MTEPRSGAEVLAQIQPRLREQTRLICLRPDLLDAWEEANEELSKLKSESGPGRLASRSSKRMRELAEAVQAVEAQIDETQLRVTFRAMPKDEWSALTEKHPPRRGNQVDQFLGYDNDATLDAAVRACMVDPVFEDCLVRGCDHKGCGSWQQFIGVCNPSEWRELREGAAWVNQAVTSTPKSPLAASVLARPAGTSKPPATGG